MRLVQWLAYNPSTHVSVGAQDTQSLAGGEPGVGSFLDSETGGLSSDKMEHSQTRGVQEAHTPFSLPARARARSVPPCRRPTNERDWGQGFEPPTAQNCGFHFVLAGRGGGARGGKRGERKAKKGRAGSPLSFPHPQFFFACVVFQPLKAGGDLSGGRVTHTRSRAHTHRSGRKKGERVRGSGQCNEREKKKHPGRD